MAQVMFSFELTDSCKEELRNYMTHLFRASQAFWSECGSRKSRIHSKRSSFFSGRSVVSSKTRTVAEETVTVDGSHWSGDAQTFVFLFR